MLVCKLVPYTDDKERWKKEADHSALGGGRLNNQVNLHMRLMLGGPKISRSPRLPATALEAYIEALSGLSYVYHPDGLNNTLPAQGSILVNAPPVGTVGRTHITRAGEEGRRRGAPK